MTISKKDMGVIANPPVYISSYTLTHVGSNKNIVENQNRTSPIFPDLDPFHTQYPKPI